METMDHAVAALQSQLTVARECSLGRLPPSSEPQLQRRPSLNSVGSTVDPNEAGMREEKRQMLQRALEERRQRVCLTFLDLSYLVLLKILPFDFLPGICCCYCYCHHNAGWCTTNRRTAAIIAVHLQPALQTLTRSFLVAQVRSQQPDSRSRELLTECTYHVYSTRKTITLDERGEDRNRVTVVEKQQKCKVIIIMSRKSALTIMQIHNMGHT